MKIEVQSGLSIYGQFLLLYQNTSQPCMISLSTQAEKGQSGNVLRIRKCFQIRKCFIQIRKYFTQIQNMFFKSQKGFQIRKCFWNPKMFSNPKKFSNPKMSRSYYCWRIEHSEQHGWILFELKIVYFCRVVVFSSVGFAKFFLTRMKCFAKGVGEN